jgi:hypothetical protein
MLDLVILKIIKPARSGGENRRSGWLRTILVQLLLRGNMAFPLVDHE